MPYAICRRCQAVFIVGGRDESLAGSQCPYCAGSLEPITLDDVRNHIEKQPDGGKEPQPRSEAARLALLRPHTPMVPAPSAAV
jgi:hypothetical protein